MEKILNTLAELAAQLLTDCFNEGIDCLKQKYNDIDPLVRFLIGQLFIDCHSSSQSSLLLVREGKEWDADVINRTVMEGTMKFIFLMHGTTDEVKQKAVEYWETLPDFVAVRHHERVSAMLNAIKNPDDPQWLPFKEMLLSDEQVKTLRGGTNKAERKALEQKWSFSEIAKFFAESGVPGLNFLVHLAHGYGMSSHLIHKDADGIGMAWERESRPPEKMVAAKLGHSSRIVSDTVTFALFRLHQLLRYCGRDVSMTKKIEEQHKPLFDEIEKAHKHFTFVEYGIRQ